MKILNSTDYHDKDLEKIVRECAQHLRGGRKVCKDLTIQFKTRHPSAWSRYSQQTDTEDAPNDYPSGRAYLGKVRHDVSFLRGTGHYQYGYLAKIMIPKFLKSKRRLAFVITHELAHCLGESHRRMRSKKRTYYDWPTSESDVFSFIDDMLIRTRSEFQQEKLQEVRQSESEKVLTEKPKRDVRKERYAHALQMLKMYQSKVKRDQNLLKKWQKKVKYYEKN